MPPDATDTKRRIIAAAREEFSAYGLAGARVDRIAEKAKANKRSIYVHFGPKEELFDLVVVQGLLELADVAPFDADAIPQYAGALFDGLQERPEVARLTQWALLERPTPIEAEVESYRTKVQAIRGAQDRGVIASTPGPVELMAMIIALVTSWNTASWSLRTLDDTTTADRPDTRFRDDVITAVTRLISPTDRS